MALVTIYHTDKVDDWAAVWSSRPGVLDVGTDAREWWEGFDTLVAFFDAQSPQRARLSFRDERIAAYQEGSVGWGIYEAAASLQDRTFPFRFTAIFHLERGVWKAVHVHRSVAAVNEDTWGITVPTTLETITLAVEHERPDLAAAAAPNGTVTILFTDIEASTALAERLGDRQWLDVLRRHNQVVRAQTARLRGFEVKSQGDGFMLAFSSAVDGLRCAIGIQETLAQQDIGVPLRVRIGVHTGEAIKERDDFYGKVVIKAARIAANAHGGEILVSSLVRDLTNDAGDFRFDEAVNLRLKGLMGSHTVHRVDWQAAHDRT